ncbi:hypothetical protein D1AOALGA4SA_9964 [Olavius algarvensis Delta 1 endosymbiont]|nr:hypothetical protein D1AOALGA4SA_9964 [Olavius algarvensis Delta 1 endosymbiont]
MPMGQSHVQDIIDWFIGSIWVIDLKRSFHLTFMIICEICGLNSTISQPGKPELKIDY